jgi:hypothetical protein
MHRVANNFPCNFLIADEVGLGRTIETGLILKYLLTSQKFSASYIISTRQCSKSMATRITRKIQPHGILDRDIPTRIVSDKVTFDSEIAEAQGIRLISYGEPLFDRIAYSR